MAQRGSHTGTASSRGSSQRPRWHGLLSCLSARLPLSAAVSQRGCQRGCLSARLSFSAAVSQRGCQRGCLLVWLPLSQRLGAACPLARSHCLARRSPRTGTARLDRAARSSVLAGTASLHCPAQPTHWHDLIARLGAVHSLTASLHGPVQPMHWPGFITRLGAAQSLARPHCMVQRSPHTGMAPPARPHRLARRSSQTGTA